MARLHSITTGNFTSASTWGVIDTTSYNNSESATVALTTDYSGARSSAFTPGAITISHIAVKYRDRATSPSGTLSVCLELDSGDTLVPGTEVTINIADIPATKFENSTYYGAGNWIVLKLASPVTLLAATAYQVAAKTSNSSQLTLYTLATTNLSRYLVTTTTAAPAASDDLVISGEYTGQGTSNSITVTMDNTASTDFGNATSSLVTPAIAVCSKGTLSFGTNALTNYLLKVSGYMMVYSEGSLIMGTSVNPCPRDSTMTLNFDCTSNGQFGLYMRYNSTLIMHGQSRTINKNIVATTLNADAAANATSLTVLDDTGWLDNDEIAIATTTRTNGECEVGTLNGNAGVTTLTIDGFAGVAGGLQYAHQGTNHLKADIINLTRNVKITGTSATAVTNVHFQRINTANINWVEFKFVGYNASSRRGLEFDLWNDHTLISINYCSLRGSTSSNGHFLSYSSNTADAGSITFTNNVCHYISLLSIVQGNHSGTLTVSDCVQIRGGLGGKNDINLSKTILLNNIKICGSQQTGLRFSSAGASLPLTLQDARNQTWSNITIYGCASYGLELDNYSHAALTIDGLNIIRNSSRGIDAISATGLTLKNVAIIGNTASIFHNYAEDLVDLKIINGVISGESGYTSSYGLQFGSYPLATGYEPTHSYYTFINCDFSGTGTYLGTTLTPHTTGDILLPGLATVDNTRVRFYDCKFGTLLPIDRNKYMNPRSVVTSYNHNQVADTRITWRKNGIIERETTTVRSPNTTSFKMTPNRSVDRLELSSQNGGFKYRVDSGDVLTISVAVQEDVTYNGSRARLIAKANPEIGINEDVVLATATAASDGTWEVITGTSPTITSSGYFEFTIDCNGTDGNLYVDWPIVTKA